MTNHQPTQADRAPVTNLDALRFLESACRNWDPMPPLTTDDIGDVREELQRFRIAAIEATGVAELREALERIEQWASAYPVEAFPEPDFDRADELLKAGGVSLGAISASNMRHVLSGVTGIVRAALQSQEPPK